MSADRQLVKEQRYARLLDLRFIIALLFLIFGVLVTVSGFTASDKELEQAAGINISLWTGAGCLLLSAVFGLWVIKAPPDIPHSIEADDEDDEDDTRG